MDNVKLAETYQINSKEELLEYHKQFLEEGYEGTMIRLDNGGYDVNKRSSNLLKYKDFLDEACKVVDVIPSDRRPEQGVLQCELNGKVFGCGARLSHDERIEMLKNKENYIGQTAEIRFFEYSEDGVLRFPVCVGFRLDK